MDPQNSRTQNLRLTTWNVGGVMYNLKYLNECLVNSDICFIQEHWLFPESLKFLQTVHQEFTAWGRSSNDLNLDSFWRRGKGGVAILWRKDINFTINIHEDVGNDRIIVISVEMTNGHKLYLIGVYLPSSNSSLSSYRECLETLEDVINQFIHFGTVIIAGDFNAHIGNHSGPKCLPKKVNCRGKDLTAMMSRLDLVSLNSQEFVSGPSATYYSNDGNIMSTLDHFFLCRQFLHLVNDCRVIDDHSDNLSFHLPVCCTLEMPFLSHSFVKSTTEAVTVLAWKTLQSNQSVRDAYRQTVKRNLEISDVNSNPTNVEQVEEALESVSNILKSAASITIPKTRFKSFLKPFWKYGLKHLHQKSRTLRAIWIQNGRSRYCDNIDYKNYKNAKRQFRKEMRKLVLQHESDQFNYLEQSYDTNRSSFFKAISKLQKKKGVKCSNGLRIDGKIESNPENLLNIWTKHYVDLHTPKENNTYDNEFLAYVDEKVREYKLKSLYEDDDDVLIQPFTVDQVATVCNNLPNGKSGGSDSIVYEHIKYGGESLLVVLCSIYNVICELEDVGNSIVTGIIQSLFKSNKKDRFDKNNYRGITLLNVFGKIFERLILCRLMPKFQLHGIPNEMQFAYQKDKNCILANFVLQESIAHYVERDSKVYCCFLDSAKAFDTVWINGLFYKLYNCGIRGKTWRLLYNWYNKLASCVSHSTLSSPVFRIRQGVRQGSVLSPWLFLVFNNDIPDVVNDSHQGLQIGDVSCGTILVADDVALLSSRVKGLQIMLNVMDQYSKKWRFDFNVGKTIEVTFGESTRSRNACKPYRNWKINNACVMERSSWIHVGIELSGNFSSSKRSQESSKKGREVICSLMNTGIRPGGINPIVASGAWNVMGLPRMLYGCELWWNLTQSDIDCLERTNRFAAKRMQGLSWQTRSEAAIGSLGLWTVEGHIDKAKLLFLGKLCRSCYKDIQKRTFVFRLMSTIRRVVLKPIGFIPNILDILSKYNLIHYIHNFFENQTFPSKSDWRAIVISRIGEIQFVNWRTGINSKPELCHFGAIHTSLQPIHLWKVARRNSFAAKIIANMVNIVCGNIPESFMLATTELSNIYSCKLCGINFRDITQHFVMHCSHTSIPRNIMWDHIHNNLDVQVCSILFNQSDTDLYHSIIGGIIPRTATISDNVRDQFVLLASEGIINIMKHVIACFTLIS